MRFALSMSLTVVALGMLLVGCRSTPGSSQPGERNVPKANVSTKGGGLVRPESGSAASTNAATAKATTLLPASGRIHSVSPVAPFVVVDYILGGMPPLQSTLDVFRAGQKVGQVRLSGPEQNGFVAADILNGILQVDDEVRVRGTE